MFVTNFIITFFSIIYISNLCSQKKNSIFSKNRKKVRATSKKPVVSLSTSASSSKTSQRVQQNTEKEIKQELTEEDVKFVVNIKKNAEEHKDDFDDDEENPLYKVESKPVLNNTNNNANNNIMNNKKKEGAAPSKMVKIEKKPVYCKTKGEKSKMPVTDVTKEQTGEQSLFTGDNLDGATSCYFAPKVEKKK
ncbi:unnamed protein product [Caenorhabditis angaria]|uniref:Uncharacterized protein n=1 Tax=Caenorhabditis angaria TaxID=860376 RepID=A0A9P1N8I1_9PELO|nr:unnamed protein product [Caenorhabditis angaria]